LRAVQGAVLGMDFGSVLAMAAALGVPASAAAEFMPVIEAELVAAINRQMQGGGSG